MTEESRIIQECIQKLAGTFLLREAQIIRAEVVTVDEDNRTCVARSIENSEAEYTVNLSAEANDGFMQIPAVDSTIIIAIMPNKQVYALAFSDIEKSVCVIDGDNSYEFASTGFIWNSGLNGGLINITPLTTKLNLLVSQIQTQLGLIATGISGAGGSYAPGTLTTFSKSDYEDTKIKH